MFKLAEIASLSLTDSEVEGFIQDLDKMIGFAKQLEELDTEGVEPLKSDDTDYNVFRKDEIQPSMAKEELLANAPQQKDGCFFVPKTV